MGQNQNKQEELISGEATINCFSCTSRNGSDPHCEVDTWIFKKKNHDDDDDHDDNAKNEVDGLPAYSHHDKMMMMRLYWLFWVISKSLTRSCETDIKSFKLNSRTYKHQQKILFRDSFLILEIFISVPPRKLFTSTTFHSWWNCSTSTERAICQEMTIMVITITQTLKIPITVLFFIF